MNDEAAPEKVEHAPCWFFDFALEAEEEGKEIPAAVAEELLEIIVNWVEEKGGLQVGGGYGPADSVEYPEGEDEKSPSE